MASQEDVIKEITKKFDGYWKEYRNENTEGFFKEMGLNFFIRKMAAMAHPDAHVIVSGRDIEIGFSTTFKSENFKYKLDESVEVGTEKGKFMATITYEDGILIVRQKPMEGNDSKPIQTEREINEQGEMETTIKVGDVVCKRFFRRVPCKQGGETEL